MTFVIAHQTGGQTDDQDAAVQVSNTKYLCTYFFVSEFLTFQSNILRARAAPPLHLLAGLRQLLLSRENKRGAPVS